MRFSHRTAWDRTERSGADAPGAPFDLTESNPTRAGLGGGEELLAELGHPRGCVYQPEPFGHPLAREAVAAYYAGRGTPVRPADVVLSASTSESYGWLFKLLCDPGDEVLVPTPGYPLFPFLAGLEGVTLVPFGAGLAVGQGLDWEGLARRLGPRTRALLLVSPNNPTGCFVSPADRARAVELAARHGLALVVDEVFGDYAWDPARRLRPPTFAGGEGALTFVLSGLSKVVALPQVKLGWILVSGPEPARREALARLEIVADCYLSVSTPVQLALPALLGARTRIQAPINLRVAANLAALDAALTPVEPALVRLPAEAGWYAVLAQAALPDDRLAELLAREDGVVVHPGFLFDYEEDGHFVVSLLTDPSRFREGLSRIVARLGR